MRLARVTAAIERHIAAGDLAGAAWAVARGGEVEVGWAGVLDRATGAVVERGSIFRISSMTKPVAAAAAMLLVEDGVMRLDEPVDHWLPELADRQVLVGPSLTDTVPAARPITLRDLLTFRMGTGTDFANFGNQPVLQRMDSLGLGGGAPAPEGPPEPDEWIRRFGELPLECQPGERWLYNVPADVLGVLLARASGSPLDVFLRDRVFEPLGMVDTAFFVPEDRRGRFGPAYFGPGVYDEAEGQWASPPAFPSAAAGLVSTVDDFLAFALMMAGRGLGLLSRRAREAMTMNHVTRAQLAGTEAGLPSWFGWGLGMAVQVERTGVVGSVGAYGWNGGLGSAWLNDPAEDLVTVLLTNTGFTSALPPPYVEDFWTAVYASLP
jgi:CubicO group peptidase (beta-lactamase class C family)